MRSCTASRLLCITATVDYGAHALIDPTEVYNGGFASGTTNILLRIATGRAGQSRLVKALADAFIQESVINGSQPFSIGWVLCDTTFTIKNLQSGEADLRTSYYLFRDHFIVAGPPENPADVNSTMDAATIFAKIYQAGELKNAKTAVPTRFLIRHDKSATNLKESYLLLGIGQVPWSQPYSNWYHQYPAFPIQALSAANLLKEYTLTDRGTFPLLQPTQPSLKTTMEKLKVGTDDDQLFFFEDSIVKDAVAK